MPRLNLAAGYTTVGSTPFRIGNGDFRTKGDRCGEIGSVRTRAGKHNLSSDRRSYSLRRLAAGPLRSQCGGECLRLLAESKRRGDPTFAAKHEKLAAEGVMT